MKSSLQLISCLIISSLLLIRTDAQYYNGYGGYGGGGYGGGGYGGYGGGFYPNNGNGYGGNGGALIRPPRQEIQRPSGGGYYDTGLTYQVSLNDKCKDHYWAPRTPQCNYGSDLQ